MSAEGSDFSSYAGDVQQVFQNYSSYDGRAEHDNAAKALPKIETIIGSIATQITQQTPFTSKQRALITTIEIASQILSEGDRSSIGKYIQEKLPEMPVSSTIHHILDMLSPEELAALQADGEVPTAILDLRSRAKTFALDLEIDESVDRLWLVESDQEDDDVQMTL